MTLVIPLRRTLAVAAAAALAALGSAAASASAESGGRPGYCTDDAGVTVIVDLRELGGDVVVRCAPGPGGQGFTGLDALTEAGFSVAGTQRWGMQFVCRIQGRPTAHEDLAIPGDDSYHEDCGGTPPETAYWSYWFASNGGSWRYSSISAASRTTIRGGFEGWSFHLGSDSSQPPPIQPRHAVSAPSSSPPGDDHAGGGQGGQPSSPTTSPTTSAPTTDEPPTSGSEPHRRHQNGGSGRPGQSTTQPSRTSALSPPAQHAGAAQVVTALPGQPDDGGGSATPFLIGAGLLALLGAGAGATAWRRSHRG